LKTKFKKGKKSGYRNLREVTMKIKAGPRGRVGKRRWELPFKLLPLHGGEEAAWRGRGEKRAAWRVMEKKIRPHPGILVEGGGGGGGGGGRGGPAANSYPKA